MYVGGGIINKREQKTPKNTYKKEKILKNKCLKGCVDMAVLSVPFNIGFQVDPKKNEAFNNRNKDKTAKDTIERGNKHMPDPNSKGVKL